MAYKIHTITSKSEEKFLRRKTDDFNFSKFALKELRELIQQMKKTMEEHYGVGLSANQIGLNLNIFVAEIPQSASRQNKPPKFYAVFNPKIEIYSKEKEILEEGCLSVPGIYGEVERSMEITLTGFDKNQKKIKIKAYGLLARVFQHEVDHLNGILFIDKAKNLHQLNEVEINDRRKKLGLE